MTQSSGSTPFCLCADGVRTRAQLWADVAAARDALQGHDAVCNLIETRYDFSVALLAALANGQDAVMPAARAEEAVFAALEGYTAPKVLERLDMASGPVPAGSPENFPGVARMFTSGSTGRPVAHIKDWAALVGGSRLSAEVILQAGLNPEETLIIGTTPHQHMYGMEAALFTGISHGFCIADRSVFFPADLDQMVADASSYGFSEVALVTTPPHLRYLEDAIRHMPQIRCVLSATAPLHDDVATRLETGAARQVLEIYGSTETGSLAWRRTTVGPAWTLQDGASLSHSDSGSVASVPHLANTVPLADEIEVLPDGRFHLLGRSADMVRIAGKRHSLGALNATLMSCEDVADAVVVRSTEGENDRLAVYVVPASNGHLQIQRLTHQVRTHMLRHVDPVFVPRSVTVVPEIPRNSTGKVTHHELEAMISAAGSGSQPPLTEGVDGTRPGLDPLK